MKFESFILINIDQNSQNLFPIFVVIRDSWNKDIKHLDMERTFIIVRQWQVLSIACMVQPVLLHHK